MAGLSLAPSRSLERGGGSFACWRRRFWFEDGKDSLMETHLPSYDSDPDSLPTIHAGLGQCAGLPSALQGRWRDSLSSQTRSPSPSLPARLRSRSLTTSLWLRSLWLRAWGLSEAWLLGACSPSSQLCSQPHCEHPLCALLCLALVGRDGIGPGAPDHQGAPRPEHIPQREA